MQDINCDLLSDLDDKHEIKSDFDNFKEKKASPINRQEDQFDKKIQK